jgi:hypothetical protein
MALLNRPACIGEAIANYDSVLEGEKLVKQAVDKWGKVDILINVHPSRRWILALTK